MSQLTAYAQEFLSHYSLKQKMIIAGVLIAFFSAVVAMLMWANRTEYELLYSNLEPSSASSVVADLRSNKVPYRLENGGTTIYAPADRISELRLRYIQSGYIKDSVNGYELFEKNNMGMTTFMQHLNFKRALEGELMRTINQFSEITKSRVHLVIPEERLFEGQKEGSASVVIDLRPGAHLSASQVKGIASLVANSVDGINTKDVVIMDNDGNVLADGEETDQLMGAVSNQYELRHKLEQEMQKKVRDLVSGVVGHNNTVVKVSAELNFDRLERTHEEVDPDNAAVVSENKYVESSKNASDTSNYSIQKTTANYEFGRTKETYVSNTGNIKRLTVAVLVNGDYKEEKGPDGETSYKYVPRSEEELNQIAALVKSAIGYNEDRGDVVEVQNMQLSNRPEVKDAGPFSGDIPFDFWEKIISYILLAIGLIVAMFLLKGMLKTSVSQLALPGGGSVAGTLAGRPAENAALPQGSGGAGTAEALAEPEEESISEDLYMKKLSPEARARLKANDKMTREVVKFAEESPDNATKLLRSWIADTGKQS